MLRLITSVLRSWEVASEVVNELIHATFTRKLNQLWADYDKNQWPSLIQSWPNPLAGIHARYKCYHLYYTDKFAWYFLGPTAFVKSRFGKIVIENWQFNYEVVVAADTCYINTFVLIGSYTYWCKILPSRIKIFSNYITRNIIYWHPYMTCLGPCLVNVGFPWSLRGSCQHYEQETDTILLISNFGDKRWAWWA